MDFLLSEDLIEYSKILRKYFSEKFKFENLKSFIDANHAFRSDEKKCWQELSELGCFSTFIKEEHGGLDLGSLSLVVTLEEAARVLCPLPVFENLVLGLLPLSLFLDQEKQALCLTDMLAKKLILTSSLMSDSIRESIKLNSKKKISGLLNFIPNLQIADNLLVYAHAEEGIKLLKIERDSFLKLEQKEISTFDLLAKYTQLNFKNFTDYEVLVDKIDIENYLLQIKCYTAIYLSSIARKVLELTVEYVKVRRQYGRAIGSFQAIQHKLADMAVLVEQCQSISRFSAWCIDNDPQQLREAALSAQAFVSENSIKIIEMAIQAHGGIGFTYEYELHYYLRKAQVLALSGGNIEKCCENLAEFTFSQ